MLIFKQLSMRNFFSFGNVHQVLELDANELTLIIGQNNDAQSEGEGGARNGVGKSSIIQGLTFGLFGKSIDNSIKIPNLVNKINEKGMEVHIVFEKDGTEYKVERGRSPTYFKFTKNSSCTDSEDESRGEMKDTQEELNTVLGISQTLFEHIVVLNSNVQPFLALSTSKQRDMIEELLGITQLTEKANLLKDMYKETRRLADQEKFKVQTITESNRKIEASISSLEDQAVEFEKAKNIKIDNLNTQLSELNAINFDDLYKLAGVHGKIQDDNKRIKELQIALNESIIKRDKFSANLEQNRTGIELKIKNLLEIDITSELTQHENVEAWVQLQTMLQNMRSTKQILQSKIDSTKRLLSNTELSLSAELNKLKDLENAECPLCKQNLEGTHTHADMIAQQQNTVQKLRNDIQQYSAEITLHESELPDMFELPLKPETYYSTVSDAKLHEHKLQELQMSLEVVHENPYIADVLDIQEKLSVLEHIDIPANEFMDIGSISILQFQKNNAEKSIQYEMNTPNPYIQQIETLRTESLQKIDYETYNELSSTADHQDFLIKLLTNKDSSVRKRIIEQNIQYLNKRLQYYCNKIGSQHIVEFMNDLSVDIALNGKSYDYSQLSRGERNRVIVALNLAFRDTYESLYQGINLLVCDEIFDAGLDSAGIFNAWSIMQDLSTARNKNVYVVSHREELLSKAGTILKVTKEDSFSSLEFCSADDL